MRLTTYTDYSLRVLMYLSLKHDSGELSTIDQIAESFHISRSHLTKVVHDLGAHGFIETVRGRTGGMRLAMAPEMVRIGDVVRHTETDFFIVQCHQEASESRCAIEPVCGLKSLLAKASEAFLSELDKVSLKQAFTSPDKGRAIFQAMKHMHKVTTKNESQA